MRFSEVGAWRSIGAGSGLSGVAGGAGAVGSVVLLAAGADGAAGRAGGSAARATLVSVKTLVITPEVRKRRARAVVVGTLTGHTLRGSRE